MAAMMILSIIIGLQINLATAQEKWSPAVSGTGCNLHALASNGNRIVAVGDSGAMLYSDDAARWTLQKNGKRSFKGISWGADKFVAMTSRDTFPFGWGFHRVYCSKNGITWNDDTIDSLWPWHSMRSAGNLFIALRSGNDSLSLSSNGTTWDKYMLAGIYGTCDVAWGSGTFVTVGGNYWYSSIDFTVLVKAGIIQTSPDGIHWTSRASYRLPQLNAVFWGDGKFVTAGDSGAILSSSEGTVWSRQTSGTEINFRALAWGDSQYVAVGDSGIIFSSSDGRQWTRRASGTKVNLNAVIFANHLFVAIGDKGTILVSPAKTPVRFAKGTSRNDHGVFVSGRLVSISLQSPTPAILKLYDLKGRLVWNDILAAWPDGRTGVSLPENIPSGWYHLSLQSGMNKTGRPVFIGD
jgi:hypothetical protein